MKNITAVLLTLVLLLAAVPAMAAGKINVTNERTFIIKEKSDQYYLYAKLENTGNKPIQINTAFLEVYDEEGKSIVDSNNYSSWAKYLAPGEYTYIRMSVKLEEGMKEKVDDYGLSVVGKSADEKKTVRLPSTGEYAENVKEGNKTYNYMYCTLTNDTEEPLSEFYVCFALLDDEGNILYINSFNATGNLEVMPGSTIRIRVPVEDAFVSYMGEKGIAPTQLDVICYCYEDIVEEQP